MKSIPATTRERNTARTILSLERLVADSTKPEVMRRACALRLSRLRAAMTAPTKRTATTTRTIPAAPAAPSEQAKFEAVQSFLALTAQRKALHRKRRSAGEREIFAALTLLMPAAVPQDNDPKAWRNFVAQIDGLLTEIKSIKQP